MHMIDIWRRTGTVYPPLMHTYMIDITDAHHETYQKLADRFGSVHCTNAFGVKYLTIDAFETSGITPALIAELTDNPEETIRMRVIKRF